MQITTYINDLLYRYECVIIPGFGALLTQYQSAKIDDENNMLYPPAKKLSFNKQLQTNDGLLANYIASVEKCSYETSLQRLRTYTGKLSMQLAESEVVSLSNIGDFHLNKENAVQFTPSSKQNFSTASFGLSTVEAPKISREIYQEEVASLEEKAPLYISPERRSRNSYLKYAAIAVVAITIAGFSGMKLYEGEIQKHNFAERQKANTVVETQIQEATFSIENPLPTLNLTFKKQSGKYHIIAGAFRVEENAFKKIEQLKEIGFSPTMIGVNKYGLHQVAYNSFENRLDALNNLKEIKGSQNPDAWLLVKELEK